MNELISIALALSPSLGMACVAAGALGRVKRTAGARARIAAVAEATERLSARDEEALHTATVRLPAMAAGPRPVGEHCAGSLLHPNLVGTAFGEAQQVVLRQAPSLLSSVPQQAPSSSVPAAEGERAL
ncbi:hypothetical protein M8Z33_28060 [Streptomyces sp. ZAF1911]|uniref:hypothetical protein n=1 Tax=Streptomyces sp. ZAF1911 TaxID=2944129 RepID=UPI00237AF83D|nr:hypothetical protein [Streptomyces sp. ZAF1911]MDD9380441.1 hypothetical protein [Streptomyces sp. ZAF1911]